jgi:hypothetical protein
MEKLNGDANVNAVNACKEAGKNWHHIDSKVSKHLLLGIPRFVYVSAVENNLPDFLLRG